MDNQNNILRNNPFSVNIQLPRKTIEEVKKVAKQEIENITVNPFLEYMEENNKVFTGQVAKEIRKYQAQIYTLGQIVREGQPRSSFNMKM